MSGGIRQLQMAYDPEQDRILLRVNTSTADEFRFWLTRRYAQLMQKALQAHRDNDPDVATQPSPEAQQAVQSFKREEARGSGDFQQEFKETTSFPLGTNPILAFKLSYRVENGKLELSIDPKEGNGIKMALDMRLNFNVSQLLKTSAEKAGWGLTWDEDAAIPETRVIN